MALTSEVELQECAEYIRNAALDAMVFTVGGDRDKMAKAITIVPELRDYYIRQCDEIIDGIRAKD